MSTAQEGVTFMYIQAMFPLLVCPIEPAGFKLPLRHNYFHAFAKSRAKNSNTYYRRGLQISRTTGSKLAVLDVDINSIEPNFRFDRISRALDKSC
jgi:hypothetical protein